jgi:DNA-binding response OmpR family regulator
VRPSGRAKALQVLVVENDALVAEDLSRELRRHGYLASTVSTAAEALEAHGDADMILLDLDLPDLDGLEVCRRIRAAGDVPIISMTVRGAELDCLLARMEAVLRRVYPRLPAAKVVVHGPLRIDAGAREVLHEGRRVDLTPKEFDLLYQLASQPGTTLSRRHLLSQVWNDDWSQRSRTIDTHVSSLRSKLGSSRWIVTVRGVGFRIGLG